HQDVFRPVGAQDVDVLRDGVGGAAVPEGLVHALLRGQQVDELVGFAAQEVPAALQVAQQRVRLVLREHADAAYARIDAVRQREVDDAELAAEVHGGFGAAVRQLHQPRAAAAGQHQRYRSAGQLAREDHPFAGRIVEAGDGLQDVV